MTIEFMRAVKVGSRIFTDAQILHDGNQIMICDCRIIDAAGNLFAKANATFFVIEKILIPWRTFIFKQTLGEFYGN